MKKPGFLLGYFIGATPPANLFERGEASAASRGGARLRVSSGAGTLATVRIVRFPNPNKIETSIGSGAFPLKLPARLIS